VSLLLAFGVAAVLLIIGFTLSELLIALALTTTALGTLLPMLQDADLLHTRFGSYILAIGGAGEFLPIVAIALFLSGDNPVHSTLLLIAFVVLAAAAVAVAVRPTPPRIVELLGRTLDSSSQLPIRIAVLLIALLVWVASELSLDILLGAFVAGLVVRLANKGAQPHVIERKLSSVAFGVFVPVFFIVSGMSFDVDSFRDEPVTLLRGASFSACSSSYVEFPLCCSIAATWRAPISSLWRSCLPPRCRSSSRSPRIGLDTGRMKPENAAALVGAAMLSVLVFPFVALALRRRHPAPEPEVPAPGDEPTTIYEDEGEA
jgi:Kef-type K+ transport system membrane component KefB